MPSPTNDLGLVTDPAVRDAVTAWQSKDSEHWLAAFIAGPGLTDDGTLRDFNAFSAEIGHEYFTRIERVSPDGHTVIGQFHSETWGDFRTFFRFIPGGPDGKFTKLEIGQV